MKSRQGKMGTGGEDADEMRRGTGEGDVDGRRGIGRAAAGVGKSGARAGAVWVLQDARFSLEWDAARFAAKEAFLKALGTGWARGITWQDVGIENLPSGMPRLVISGRALELAREYGVTQTHVTLSHSRGHAVAVVVLEKADAGGE